MVYSYRKLYQTLVLTLFFCSCFSFASAQKGSQMFLELGGFSKTYSGNFSLKVSKKRRKYSYVRIGLGLEENRFYVPVAFMQLKGKMDHFLELSGGLTFQSDGLQFWDRASSDIFVTTTLGFAYRYQPFRRRYYISVGLFPFIKWDPSASSVEINQFVPGYKPGISFGYTIPS